MDNILTVENLHVSFDTYAGEVHAVRGVSLQVMEGEVLAIVGESGCGKSVTAQTVMKLNPMPPARIKQGAIDLCGVDIIAMSEKNMQDIRGSMVSMIFQDPMTCLNPTMKVGRQLTEAIRKHQKISAKEAREEAIRLLEMVRIPNVRERAQQYPHQYSGGMRQRVMIAMGLSGKPGLLIADEPTTALDVTIQAEIMQLLGDIRKKLNTAIILITHDLGVVASLADRVVVMYAGRIMESGPVRDIYYKPTHPYTVALLKSLPGVNTGREEELISIPGTPPDLFAPPQGCEFAGRCGDCMRICRVKVPPTYHVGNGHAAACWKLHRDFPKARKEGK